MAVRRKSRVSPEDELRGWSDLFEVGFVYFASDLAAVGLPHLDLHNDHDLIRQHGERAWHRIGKHYMAQRSAEDRKRDAKPWAEQEWGSRETETVDAARCIAVKSLKPAA